MKVFVCLPVLMFFSVTIHALENCHASYLPGCRTVLEAHNCYPYHGKWQDRIDKALAAGLPVGIELDLAWHEEGNDGAGRLILAHDPPYTDKEPELKWYFFEGVRPLIEEALQFGDRKDWPLITLNINDIRGTNPKMHESVWTLTGEYEDWLCTAVKGPSPDPIAPLEVKPIVILAGSGPLEIKHFYDVVPVGGKLRIFGSGSPDQPATNFRRWINYSWRSVEPEGQLNAGELTQEDASRLEQLVNQAHQQGYWIRFYALNGHPIWKLATNGWSPGYNFGSLTAVQERWSAAIHAGVDFLATDQIQEAFDWKRGMTTEN